MIFDRVRLSLVIALLSCSTTARADNFKVVTGLKQPESVAIGSGGKILVALPGELGKNGDGSVVIVDPSARTKVFATGLDDPRSLLVDGNQTYVVDRTRIWRIDASGKLAVFVELKAFPRRPLYLSDITTDGHGTFYVTDSGDRAGNKGVVYRVDPTGKVTLVLDAELTMPVIDAPGSVLNDDEDHFFLTDVLSGYLYRYDLETSTAQRVGGGFGGPVGLVRDGDGRLFVGDNAEGKLFEVDSILEEPTLLSEKFQVISDLCISPDRKSILVLDRKAGTLTWFPIP